MARFPSSVRAVLLALAVSGFVTRPFFRSARSWQPTALSEFPIAPQISRMLGPRPFLPA